MREIKVSWVRLRTSAGFRAVYTAGEYFAAQMKIRDGGLCKEYSRFTSHVP
jgi:2-methylisocitrate lyase-like PEP mutase family enzyme